MKAPKKLRKKTFCVIIPSKSEYKRQRLSDNCGDMADAQTKATSDEPSN